MSVNMLGWVIERAAFSVGPDTEFKRLFIR